MKDVWEIYNKKLVGQTNVIRRGNTIKLYEQLLQRRKLT